LSSGRQSACRFVEFTTFCRTNGGDLVQGTIIPAASRAFVAATPDEAQQADRDDFETGEGVSRIKPEATLLQNGRP
jgi:hypothetical protein